MRLDTVQRFGQSLLAGLLVVFFAAAGSAWAQTGKITGQVTDAETGDPLPGVNVILAGTNQGATTDAEGNYTILNIDPGTYDVQASFVGYATQTVEGVEVNIGLTSEVSFELQEQTQELQEVTVQAEERVVKQDISSSRIDVSTEDVENMPVNDIENVVGLQAGIRPNLEIRGSGREEVSFQLDGMSTGSSRTNSPYTNVSYTSVKQVQVQTGGFNAEYGNVRAGMINVVTREGPRNRYTFDVLARYSPPQSKSFGIDLNDPMAYYMRPYKDPEVKWEGTDQWPAELQKQYPNFIGYNEVSEQWNSDDNPNNDLTPEQLEELFDWRHRRDITIDQPDYEFDGSIGGPVPVVSSYLGDLRFFASYRQEQSQYIHPLSRDGYEAYNGRIKLTSNPASGIKVNLQLMQGYEEGANCWRTPHDNAPQPCRFGDRELTRNYSPPWIADGSIFVPGALSQSDITRQMGSLSFTHTLSANTFYEVRLKRLGTEYDTHPLPAAQPETVKQIGPMEVDQAPLGGWYFEGRDTGIAGLDIGGHTAEFRDTSFVGEWNGEFDITSQVNQVNQVKAGVSFGAANYDINYGHIDFLVNPNDLRAKYEETGLTGAAYVQDKIEYLGMIANVGVRLDYQDPNHMWWAYQDPFTEAFMGKNANQMSDMLDKAPVDPKWEISPRLGVSFPITEVSKLYFNWGQFVQQLEPGQLYTFERMQTTSGVWRVANPATPMPKTTAFELGYEQSIFDQYLIRIAGYYKDITNETMWVDFNSRSGLVDYESNFPNAYRDVRGAEFSLYKNVGTWVRGFINYTYQVETQGQFGLPAYFENPVQQATFEETAGANFPFSPVPQPFGRISVDFMTPTDFGPEIGGSHLLGDWRLNFLGRWRAGDWFTYTGEINAPNVANNMQWEDYKMVDARLMKNFNVGGVDAMFYVDVSNVFNIKNFNQGAFEGPRDFENYIESLKIKPEFVEDIPNFEQNGWGETGDDKPGELGKDYIDPPNMRSIRHLWPRRFRFGARFSF